MGQIRSFGKVFGLSIVTLGIYMLCWFHAVLSEIGMHVQLKESGDLLNKAKRNFWIMLVTNLLSLPVIWWLAFTMAKMRMHGGDVLGLTAALCFGTLVTQFFFGMFFLSFLKVISAAQLSRDMEGPLDVSSMFGLYSLYAACVIIGQAVPYVGSLLSLTGLIIFIVTLYKTNGQINRIWQEAMVPGA